MTAAECSSGIRVYTKTKDGDVREGCNDTTYWQLSQARRTNDIRKKYLDFFLKLGRCADGFYQVSLITATAGTQVNHLHSDAVKQT